MSDGTRILLMESSLFSMVRKNSFSIAKADHPRSILRRKGARQLSRQPATRADPSGLGFKRLIRYEQLPPDQGRSVFSVYSNHHDLH